MELKELILALWGRRKIIGFFLLAFVFLALVWQWSQPEKHRAVFPIDISRKNYQKTDDYQYDQFYRLQADEKFGENISNWLEDPAVRGRIFQNFKEIRKENGFDASKNIFDESLEGKKLSSSYVQASLTVSSKEEAMAASQAIRRVMQEKTKELNSAAEDPNWFKVEVGEPAMEEYGVAPILLLSAAAVAGLIIGAFAALFDYYFRSNEDRN